MLLTIDIGNSYTKGALFKGKEIYSTFYYPTIKRAKIGEITLSIKEALFSYKEEISDVYISSVVRSLDEAYITAISNLFNIKPRLIRQGEKNIIPANVDNLDEVGADILCLSRGAYKEFKEGLFIVDLGTADKMIYLSKDGVLEGLAIDCGLRVGLEALLGSASALEKEDQFEVPASPLGKNTKDCIDAGLLYGTAYKIRGFKKAYEEIAGQPLKGVLTGGNSFFVKDLLSDFIHDKYLLLKGLRSLKDGD